MFTTQPVAVTVQVYRKPRERKTRVTFCARILDCLCYIPVPNTSQFVFSFVNVESKLFQANKLDLYSRELFRHGPIGRRIYISQVETRVTIFALQFLLEIKSGC